MNSVEFLKSLLGFIDSIGFEFVDVPDGDDVCVLRITLDLDGDDDE